MTERRGEGMNDLQPDLFSQTNAAYAYPRLDAAESARRKAEGRLVAITNAGAWREAVIAEASAWCKAQRARGLRTVTIEEFRAQAKVQPESHKAWGVLPRLLVAAGMLRPLIDAHGEPVYKRAASPKTHAHPVRVWELN